MNTAAHPVAPEEVMAFVDGELSADRAQTLSAHIDQCAECREVVESLRASSQSMAKWAVDPPQKLNASALLSTAKRVASEGESKSSHSLIRDMLTHKWVWASALSVVVTVFAFAAFLPGLFFARKSVSVDNAAVRERGAPLDVLPYVRKLPADAEKAGGGGDGYFSQARTVANSPKSGGDLEEKGLASPEDRFTRSDARQIPPPPPLPAAGLFGKLQVAGQSYTAPMIARTVSLFLVVKDFNTSRTALDSILVRHNGYAAALNVSTPQGAARALQASLRIPAPQLASALVELKGLGRVEVETQNGEEVTQMHADLLARLKNSRETEQRLQDVLRTRTGKVKDVLEVEEEIARVRGEIEQMEAEQKTLEHRVDFATIDLKLAEEYKAQLSSPAPSVGTQLRNASVNGFRNAFESLLALVLFLAESGPTLLLWFAVLSFPGWLLWKRYRRLHAMASSVEA